MDTDKLAELVEEKHLQGFQEFYAGLPRQQKAFYMFFTSGLLHWVYHSVRLVPADVNLILLGSALDLEEQAWVRTHLGRPFHHIELEVDDKTIWEFLFRTNRYDFGWLDIDCFVLEPELFYAMATIEPDIIANCIFSFRGPNDVDVLLTYFLFLNVDVFRSVTAQVAVSPCTYSAQRSRAARKAPYAFAKVLTPEISGLLARVLPLDADGKPVYFSENRYYDTLQVYQTVAQVLGYRLRMVRSLDWGSSEEVVHIGKVSYYRTRWNDLDTPQKEETYSWLLQIEYLLLANIAGQLPARYARHQEELARELEERTLPLVQRRLWENLRGMALAAGLSERALSRITNFKS